MFKLSKNKGKNIIEIFHEVYNLKKKNSDQKIWCYYNCDQNFFPTNVEEIFEHPKNFIEKYIRLSGKCQIINDLILADKKRNQHSISTFLIGMHLYLNVKIIKDNIDTKIFNNNIITQTNLTIEFCYYWFLICLYHDLGYVFEKKPEEILKTNFFNDLTLNLTHPDLKESKLIPSIITQNYSKYFYYVLIKHNKLEHGIIAGLLLFMALNQGYVTKQNNQYDETIVTTDVIKNEIWNDIIWPIIGHNIWYINKNDSAQKEKIDNYTKTGLKDLIINEPVINIKDHPLLYLLCLVDSIEPIKKITDLDCDNNVFNNKDLMDYKISLSDTKITFFNHKNVINDLKYWLKFSNTYSSTTIEI